MGQYELMNISEKKKFKLYRNKKFIAYGLAGAMLASAFSIGYVRTKNNKLNDNSEYVVGYDNIGIFNKITNQVTDKNFVLLNVGDHKRFGTFFLEQKLDYCVDNGIDIGLVLSSNASSLSDIYFDLEYVMGILEKYDINYPVYLKIDGIIANEDLMFDSAFELISAFLDKAKGNNIDIGLFVENDNDEFLLSKIKELDVRVLFDNNWLLDDGGDILKNDSIYYADLDLKNWIEDYSYNNPNLFKEDGYHIVKDGESLQDVSRLYNLSVRDLKKYNDIYFDNVKSGNVLRIPSIVQNKNDFLNVDGLQAKVGIDVSLWQNEIKWQNVDVDYAIIQIRDFANDKIDPRFESNVQGCLENGIPFGFYAFSRATTIEDVKKEAEYVISQIEKLSVTYPVYLDLETEFWPSFDNFDSLSLEEQIEKRNFVIDFIKTWEFEIKKVGFVPGIYCNSSLYAKINHITDNYLDNLQCWVAGGEYYDQEISYGENQSIPIINLDESDKIAMRQISSMGLVDGIEGYVDLNYCYADYETNYDWERMEFPKIQTKVKSMIPFLLIGAGGIVGVVRRRKRKKVKKKCFDI